MNMMTSFGAQRFETLVDGLRTEFGAIQAQRIIEAEALDFLWDARVKERYLGQFFGDGLGEDEGDRDLSRVAVLSVLDGVWHVACCVVDGEGDAIDLLWSERFDRFDAASFAFGLAR